MKQVFRSLLVTAVFYPVFILALASLLFAVPVMLTMEVFTYFGFKMEEIYGHNVVGKVMMYLDECL